MVAFPVRDNTVQLIKETADIVQIIGEHVNLKKTGANFKGLCPFHGEKTPSFIVNQSRQTFHCFGCAEGGDVFSFLMKYHHYTFPDALKELAQRCNIPLPEKHLSKDELEKSRQREHIFTANNKAAALFHQHLLTGETADDARRYLEHRGISREIIAEFQLGYAPDSWNFLTNALAPLGLTHAAREAGLLIARENGKFYDRFRDRIVFPITNISGRVAGFGGRIVGRGEPKYLNTPETPVFDKGRILFGLCQHREVIRQTGRCLLVEGNFDLITLAAHGIKNVVAPLGTSLTQNHIHLLKGYCEEVILLFDGDEAGVKAALRAAPFFLTEQLNARIVTLPADADPDSFIRQHGPERLAELIDRSLLLSEFVFEHLADRYGLTLEGKNKIVKDLLPLVAAIGDHHLQRTMFVSHFSERLGLAPEVLLNVMPAHTPGKPPPTPTPPAPAFEKIALPKQQEQLIQFLVSYPEYLDEFTSAGIDEVLVDPASKTILQTLRNAFNTQEFYGPEMLLHILTGAECSLISRLLVDIPSYTEEQKQTRSGEITAYLRGMSLKNKRTRLSRQIGEAQQANDEKLLFELLQEMGKINNTMMMES